MTVEKVLANIEHRIQYAAERVERARAAYTDALNSNEPANRAYHHARLERYQQVLVELVLLKDDIDFEVECDLEEQAKESNEEAGVH